MIKNLNKQDFLNNPIEENNIIYSAKELIPHLLCPICRGLVREPILGCSICTIYGCGPCIQKWVQQSQNQHCLNGCKNPKFQKIVNPVLKTILDFIEIRCPNFNNSSNFKKCQSILNYNNYQKHIQDCEYRVRKCMYSSCSKKQTIKNIEEHEKECNNKNPQIYVIFREHDKTPMKIEIDLPMQTEIEILLNLLSEKIQIPRKNIELVFIKNQEIVEYIQRRNVNIQYIAVHDGFLFAFQKYSTKYFNEQQQLESEQNKKEESKYNGNNKTQYQTNCQIHLELLIINEPNNFKPEFQRFIQNKECQRCPTYTRVFHFSQYTSFKEIHIKIYKFFKPYMKNYYLKELDKNQQLKDMKNQYNKIYEIINNIDFQDYSLNTLQYEYEQLILDKEEQNQQDDEDTESVFSHLAEQSTTELNFNLQDIQGEKLLSNSQFYQYSQNQINKQFGTTDFSPENNQKSNNNNINSISNNNNINNNFNKNKFIKQPFFKIVFKENMATQLPYNNKYFHDYYKLDEQNETQFVLALIINPCLEVLQFKLNRCVQAPFILNNLLLQNINDQKNQQSQLQQHNQILDTDIEFNNSNNNSSFSQLKQQ